MAARTLKDLVTYDSLLPSLRYLDCGITVTERVGLLALALNQDEFASAINCLHQDVLIACPIEESIEEAAP
jgi:hypothetical protein